jgi:hypothetical protein
LGVDERVIGQLVVFLSLFSPNKGGYVPSNDDFDIVHSRQCLDVVMVITKEKLFTTFLMAIHFARLIQRLPPVNFFLFDCV